MNIMRSLLPISTLAILSITVASAATITSYNRNAFATALSGGTVSGQNFDALANGTVLGTLNGVTYGASLGNPIVTSTYLTTTNPNGLGSTSIGYFQSTETATFSFATAITAFGIDVNTFAPTAGDYSATINLGNVVLSKFDVFPGAATGQFIGFISDTPFTSVTIQSITDPNLTHYTYTLDSLVYGNAAAIVNASAPEPATLSSIGVGFAILGLAFRKRFAK